MAKNHEHNFRMVGPQYLDGCTSPLSLGPSQRFHGQLGLEADQCEQRIYARTAGRARHSMARQGRVSPQPVRGGCPRGVYVHHRKAWDSVSVVAGTIGDPSCDEIFSRSP